MHLSRYALLNDHYLPCYSITNFPPLITIRPDEKIAWNILRRLSVALIRTETFNCWSAEKVTIIIATFSLCYKYKRGKNLSRNSLYLEICLEQYIIIYMQQIKNIFSYFCKFFLFSYYISWYIFWIKSC